MARETKKQRQERFIQEFLQRLREAPEGERVYMRVDGLFNPADVHKLNEWRTVRRAAVPWRVARWAKHRQLRRSIRLAPLVIVALAAKLLMHRDEGWRLHQPATLRQGGFPRKWDVAVSTANIAEWRQPSLGGFNDDANP